MGRHDFINISLREIAPMTQHVKTILSFIFIAVFLLLQYFFIGQIMDATAEDFPLIYELFAAVIGSVITVISMAMIMRNQIDRETNKEFASRIFEQKIIIYQDLLATVFSIDDDGVLDEEEIHALENQVGVACLVANKQLVSKLAQYMYQLKVYGVLYFRNLDKQQLEAFSNFIKEEKQKKSAQTSVLCDQKFNINVPVEGNEIQYFLSLDEFIQGLREDLALIDGDVSHDIEHFVRTPINPLDVYATPKKL
jgi:hypothetical protein